MTLQERYEAWARRYCYCGGRKLCTACLRRYPDAWQLAYDRWVTEGRPGNKHPPQLLADLRVRRQQRLDSKRLASQG